MVFDCRGFTVSGDNDSWGYGFWLNDSGFGSNNITLLNFPNITQIEALFSEMEPANLIGESFTPSLHTEEIMLEDIPAEPEEDEEPSSCSRFPVAKNTGTEWLKAPIQLR